MPLFSIVIPTYNRANFVLSSIHSVLNQDFIDYEIILIDDGSTDTTRQLIKESYSGNNKVKYFFQENSERGVARNNGIKIALGEYIVFLDSDDTMHANHLQILNSLIKKHPDANFVATKYELLRNNKKTSPLSCIKEGWHDYRLFLEGNPLAANFCIKRSNPSLQLFQENRKYAAMEDWMFLLQNMQNDEIYISDAITITMNDHDDRSMRRDNENIIQKRMLATDWIIKNVSLTNKEMQTLKGYTNYFCAVHSYADNKRLKAASYLLKAVNKIGIKKSFLVLALKILAGYNLIQKLK